MSNKYEAYIIMLSTLTIILASLIFYTKTLSTLALPYLLLFIFLIVKHRLFDFPLNKNVLIEYLIIFSIILLAQTTLVHYYWNNLYNEFSNIFFNKEIENSQSIQLYKEFLYNMDEVITHKYMFLSLTFLLISSLYYIYENRDNIKEKETILSFFNTRLSKFFAILIGVLSFFLAVESEVLNESLVLFGSVYFTLLYYARFKKSKNLLTVLSTFELYFFTFIAMAVVKAVLFFRV